jgi:hypothetical protein
MCRAALQRIVVLLVLTFLSGVSVQAAPLVPMVQPFNPTVSVLNDGHCAPLGSACPLSGLAGCVTGAGCFAAAADTSGRLAPYTPHFRASAWYAGQPDAALGLSVEPNLFPPISSV